VRKVDELLGSHWSPAFFFAAQVIWRMAETIKHREALQIALISVGINPI